MLPTSLCRHTRYHQTRLALYSSQAHSGIVSATLEQLAIMYTWLHSCPDRPSTYLSGLAERGESPQVRGTSPAYAARRARHCHGIMSHDVLGDARQPGARDDLLRLRY